MQLLDHPFGLLSPSRLCMQVKMGALRDQIVPRVQIYDLMVYLVVLVVFGLRIGPFGLGFELNPFRKGIDG